MWDLNDINAPEPEAVQAEREIVEEIVRNEPNRHLLAAARGLGDLPIGGYDHGEDDAADDRLHDRLHAEALAQAERDTAAYVERRDGPVETGTVTFKRLRNGAWGIAGPSALLVTGQPLVVTKRDGSTTEVVCGKVVWSGDGRAIAATRRA